MRRVPEARLAAGTFPPRWGTAGFTRGGGHDTLRSDGKRTCGDATDCGAGRGPPHLHADRWAADQRLACPSTRKVIRMKQEDRARAHFPGTQGGTPPGVELRHLRYFVAVADAGTFTHAAERMFIAQPTLSQQVRRLEELVGAPLLQRRREGVRLTPAGLILLEESRTVLSLLDHAINGTRHAAGLGQPRLRVVLPPDLPEMLVLQTAPRLRAAATAADIDIVWIEAPLDAEFSLIRQRRADAGLGWLPDPATPLPSPLDSMELGAFEPEVWIPRPRQPAQRHTISLDELARMSIIHGPRRAGPAIYDTWLRLLRTANPKARFTDPPISGSLPLTLSFAATAGQPTAVLTSPLHPVTQPCPDPELPRSRHAPASRDMIPAYLGRRPLTATAALVWSTDLPRPLQQVLCETAGTMSFPGVA
jgi:DNA-binding transcriptional LysR family regulator